jgi:hypothetical protein
MIRILFFFLLLGFGLYGDPYQIVFIHLGKDLPPYLSTALSQARLFNPNADLILIANQEAIEPFEGVRLISAESLHKTPDHELFLLISVLDRQYRDGFWFYTTERLFYLNDLICQYQLKNTFHLENDNLLYADLEELLPLFVANYPGIAAPFEQDDRGAASFIFVADQESISALVHHLNRYTSSGQSEMYLLSSFKSKFGKKYADHLPVITRRYGEEHNPLKDSAGRIDRLSPEHYSRHFDQFQSLFDMCSYGQYLGGIDPRNGSDGPGYINLCCIFNCSEMGFDWKLDSLGRKVPFVTYQGEAFRINNLHIHSKNLKEFASVH